MRGKRALGDLDEDIRDHIDRETQENIERGLSPEEARRQAMLTFGSVALAKEDTRAVWVWVRAEQVLQDVRHALRGFRRTPSFTIIALLTLTVAIGANTAIFSLQNALTLRKVPVPDPDRIVHIAVPTVVSAETGLSYPLHQELERRQSVLLGLVGWTSERISSVDVDGVTHRVATLGVTGEFYRRLGIGPSLGRLLEPSDAVVGAAPVAVLGFSFWQRAFAGDASIVGRAIAVEGQPFTIVGVTPEGFTGMSVLIEPDLTVALPAWFAIADRPIDQLDIANMLVVNTAGRLRPGVDLEQARAQLSSLWPHVKQEVLDRTILLNMEPEAFLRLPFVVKSGATGPTTAVRAQYRDPLYAVLRIALLILLIASVNLASLMLSRAASREPEIAVRMALGASRGRLVRQVPTEGVLLSSCAVAGGLVLATATSRVMARVMLDGAEVPLTAFDPSPDLRVFAFASVIALMAASLFSLAPLWRLARQHGTKAPSRHARTVARTGRFGRLLVATQVALSLVLIVHASLLLRSLYEVRSVDPGLNVDGVVVSVAVPQPAGYRDVDNDVYYPAVIERLRGTPGVDVAAISQLPPLARAWEFPVAPVGQTGGVEAQFNSVSPGLFEALGVRIVSGRDFAWSDNSRAPRVAVVSQHLARRLFGEREALHQRIRLEPDPRFQDVEIVGIVADARAADVRSPNLNAMYVPSLQNGPVANFKAIVTRGIAGAREINEALQPLGRELVQESLSLSGVLDRTLVQERITAALAAFFGVLALLLCAIGLYAVAAYAVAQRTREIGIRMALGARAGSVLRAVVWQTMIVAGCGVALGLPIAWATVTWVRSLLFGVQPRDPFVFVASLVALLAVAVGASVIPARRAARVKPTEALRAE